MRPIKPYMGPDATDSFGYLAAPILLVILLADAWANNLSI